MYLKGFRSDREESRNMPRIRHEAGKPSEFRELQVVQSVIYSSEGGRWEDDHREDWKEM